MTTYLPTGHLRLPRLNSKLDPKLKSEVEGTKIELCFIKQATQAHRSSDDIP